MDREWSEWAAYESSVLLILLLLICERKRNPAAVRPCVPSGTPRPNLVETNLYVKLSVEPKPLRCAMPLTTTQVIPILRIFDVEKAKEFYLDYLGFKVDWEHRFEEDSPLYMQISLGEFVLHLSEHYGDGCPG